MQHCFDGIAKTMTDFFKIALLQVKTLNPQVMPNTNRPVVPGSSHAKCFIWDVLSLILVSYCSWFGALATMPKRSVDLAKHFCFPWLGVSIMSSCGRNDLKPHDMVW